MKKKIFILILTLILLCFIPAAFYIYKLGSWSLSSSKEDWGTFGDYFGGILNPFIGILTLGVTTYIAVSFNEYQKRQNKESNERQERLIRPLANILVGDYEEQIQVKIRNAGLGPLTIKEANIFSPDSSVAYKNLIDLMPQHPEGLTWTDFVFKLEGKVIATGAEMNLLELTGKTEDETFEEFKNKVRYALKDIVIEILYTDIYENEMPKTIQLLDIYRRHFHNDKRHLNESKMNKMDILAPLLSYLQNGIKLINIGMQGHSDISNPKNEKIIALWKEVKSEISKKNQRLVDKMESNPDDEIAKKGLEYELAESLEDKDFKVLLSNMLDDINKLEDSSNKNKQEKIESKNIGDGNITIIKGKADNITTNVKK